MEGWRFPSKWSKLERDIVETYWVRSMEIGAEGECDLLKLLGLQSHNLYSLFTGTELAIEWTLDRNNASSKAELGGHEAPLHVMHGLLSIAHPPPSTSSYSPTVHSSSFPRSINQTDNISPRDLLYRRWA